MCLYTDWKKPKRAKIDIFVYKDITVHKSLLLVESEWDGYAEAKYANHLYSKKETAPLKHRKHFDSFKVTSGLHAYTSFSDENSTWLIPKGAKYYISDDGREIVSNKMIFSSCRGVTTPRFVKRSFKRWIIKWDRYFTGIY